MLQICTSFSALAAIFLTCFTCWLRRLLSKKRTSKEGEEVSEGSNGKPGKAKGKTKGKAKAKDRTKGTAKGKTRGKAKGKAKKNSTLGIDSSEDEDESGGLPRRFWAPTVEGTIDAVVGGPGASAAAREPTFSDGEGSDGANSSPPLSQYDWTDEDEQ